MKYLWILLFIFTILSPHIVIAASEKNATIDSASQFQNWCKTLSYRYFLRKKQKAYNWSASTIRKLNDYKTTGQWKVGDSEKVVSCQIHKGKKAKWTQFKIR